ncbi:Hpt domain-containing protein [candidate division KSB1 bacterium]|nr:Hpt domain-containing protein [candidate division KSB1 bacterium]
MSEKVIVYVDSDLEELVPEFIENRYEDIEKINAWLDSNEMGEIQRLGHSMKGSGGGYGFHELTNLGGELEQAAMRGDKGEIDDLNKKLAQYLKVVKVVYQDMD